MVRFKVAMGFPMIATALWLLGLVTWHYGIDRIFWLGLYLVLVALSFWIFGEFIQHRGASGPRRHLATAMMVGTLALAYFWVLEREVNWRTPPQRQAGSVSGRFLGKASLIDWQTWSREAVDQAVASGRPVLVDFTALWCATCQDNKRRAINIQVVADKMKSIQAVAFKADFTDEDPVIADELARFNRAAVPLVVVYSVNPEIPPRVLPEFITRDTVLSALEWAANPMDSLADTARDR
jgi:thiol:disulfide interchange protein DsbD